MKLVLAALLLTAPAARAQSELVQAPDLSERFLLGLTAFYDYTEASDGSEVGRLRTDATLGYFLSSSHEIGLRFGGAWTDLGALGDSLTTQAGLFYNLNFGPGPETQFFVGLDGGAFFADSGGSDTTALLYGGHVGVRQRLTDGVYLKIEPRFERRDLDVGEEDAVIVGVGLDVLL